MSKKSCFREPFDKQHGKRAQALFTDWAHQLYRIHWSLGKKLSWKKSLLLTCQVLGLLVNTLSTDEKHLVFHRDNLTIPIKMQLSQKQKVFLNFLLLFWSLAENLHVLKKKMALIAFVFPKIRISKTRLDKCLKSPVSEDVSTSYMVKAPKYRWNLHHSTFIIYIDHWKVNCVGKYLSY